MLAKRKRSALTLALSHPNTLGKIVECDRDGNVRERKTLLCDGKLIAVKVGKSWIEIQ